ncbi:5-(carboxyamino)imidazole ribonucleotide synthase [Alicyclobacillus tolerans]|uniref:N5-carboxyaminoimidazole ribonucleotide synthase n=2 Tax=Alicyclobacillus tolerans TaxID=90970 RepID=A0A1M6KDI4_9BACL|nr:MULTISPECIES: 5-(carboxyamino)imidazole ribonucleotide synthase [Alicyclobacillus]MDP9727242.1 5-(carboxyamino)imidazole ribonucleotide synthase [Alicyclobacillus tengchongensis]SHJ57005.1 5-(carboxyamino)imidazole ribonucleotide synthase [Alicyclobacillus montanus]
MSSAAKHVILPGQTIGILGGGQLGRMMALAGRAMGYRFVVLDPAPDSPAAQVADAQVEADYSDVKAARQLAKEADIITYEFENVDAQVASILSDEAYMPQGSHLLFITQHRIREKQTMEKAGVPVAKWRAVFTFNDLKTVFQESGQRGILKTTRGGYDGKGQWRIVPESRLEDIWNECQPYLRVHGQDEAGPLIYEWLVPFVREISVIVTRGVQGEQSLFPVIENHHQNGILYMSIVPARIPEEAVRLAQQAAVKIADQLQLVGTLAVEMFLTESGEVLVNELAPRPHNSGHLTIEACATSQFEQHIRAICGLPLAENRLLTPAVMVNVLGQHLHPLLEQIDRLPRNVKLHLYGKREPKVHRKMGHLTCLGDIDTALQFIGSSKIWATDSER